MGGVHQQKADARMLLLGEFVRLQAPEVPQGKIAGAIQVRVLAAMAALPQEQGPAKGPAEAGGEQGGGVHGTVLIHRGEVAVFPALHLVAEPHSLQPLVLFLLNGPGHVLPHAGGGHAVAHQVAGGQVLRAAAQKAVQPIHLAGGAGKQHRPGLYSLPDLPEDAVQVALDVLGPPQPPQVLLPEAGDVPQVLVAVHGGAVDHAAPFQHVFRNGGENAAGGGILPDGVVPVPGGKGGRQVGRRAPVLQNGADTGAAPAADAFFHVNLGKIKAGPVPDHGDGVLGTACCAGGASGAAAPLRQLWRGGLPLRLDLRRRIGPVFQGRLQIVQRAFPGGGQGRLGGLPIHGGQQLRRVSLADDPVGQAQAAQNAHRPGPLRGRQLRRRDRGEEGPVELDGEHRAVEGIGDHIIRVPEQVQELRRTGVQDLPGLGVDLLPDAAQLHHRQSRLPAEPVDVGRQRPGTADAVAENIPPGGIVCRMVGHGGPLLRRQQQRGVQHHRHVPSGHVPDDLPALGLPDGDMGKAVQVALQLRPHPLGNHGDAEGGGVGNAALLRKGAEEHRVEPAVRENFRIPDLVAAGEDQVIGQFRGGQLVKAFIAML